MVNAESIKYLNPRYFRLAASPFNWVCTTSSTYPRLSAIFDALGVWLFNPIGASQQTVRPQSGIQDIQTQIPQVLGS